MRVLVTGHKGYIGAVMVPILRRYGHSIIGIDSDLYRYSTYGAPPDPVEELIKDVRDIEIADLDGVDAIVSLAALSNDVLGDLNPDLTYEINYQANVRLAEMAKGLGIQRFIFASSCSMYGAAGDSILDERANFNPVTAYAISKVRTEHDLSQMATDEFSPTFMRNSTAYGMSPRIRFDVVLNNLSAWAYTTGKVHMKSDGLSWRPIVHVEDTSKAVAAVLSAPREKIHNQAYNIGINSENYQIRQLAELVYRTIPNCELSFADDAEPDLRSYRVNFDKYHRDFPDFPLEWNALAGAKSIYESYMRVGLDKDDYEGPKFKRIAQLKTLMSSGLLDDSMRWMR